MRLLLRGGRPVFDPPLEELRLVHYGDTLGAFLGLPAKMKVGRKECLMSTCNHAPGWQQGIDT